MGGFMSFISSGGRLTTFDSLPYEVKTTLVSYLNNSKDLLSLSSVSRDLRAIVHDSFVQKWSQFCKQPQEKIRQEVTSLSEKDRAAFSKSYLELIYRVQHYHPISWFNQSFIKNPLFAMGCVANGYPIKNFKYLQDNDQVAETVVNVNGLEIEHLSERLQAKKDLAILAVSNNGLALACVSKDLQNDPEVVTIAVLNNPEALRFASEECRNDRNIVQSAIQIKGEVFEFASLTLQEDEELQIIARDNTSKNSVLFDSWDEAF